MGRTGDSFDDVPTSKWGKKPSPRRSPCREETGWPLDEMIVAVMSQPVFKKRQLDDLGITYKKDTGELIIRNPNEAAKDSLGRILVDLKNKQQALKKEKQAVEDLHTCLPIGS